MGLVRWGARPGILVSSVSSVPSRQGTGSGILSIAASAVLAASGLTFAWAGLAAAPVSASTTGPDSGWVAAFGNDSSHQIDVPDAAKGGIVAISASSEMAMALTWDGKVVAWGDDEYGQTNVPAGLPKVKAISAGGDFAVALTSAGKVVAWGNDQAHQTEVPAAAQSGVVAISAGDDCVIALRSDGTIVTWGDNTYGQISVPWVPKAVGNLTMVLPLSNLKAASASNHVLGIKSDGTVAAWGNNNHGQTNVPSGLSNVTAVSAGYDYSLALTSSGAIAAWGNNASGQLNTPCSLYNFLTHVCVSKMSGFSGMAAGNRHALAIKNGYLYAWGDNTYGQATIPDFWKGGGFVSVAAGSDFSLGLYGVPGLPQAPTMLWVTPGDGQIMVTYSGVGGNGSPVEYYTVTTSPGGKTTNCAPGADENGWSHCLVTGVKNGTYYTFTVTATTAIGTGAPSAPSTPAAPTHS